MIYGLGIRHIGERGAQVLARAFGSMEALETASLEALQATSEIGPVLAASARSWLDEPRNRELVSRLRAAGVRMEVPESERLHAAGPGPLTGRTYVITGTLASMTREEATAALERLGAKVDGLGQQENDGRDCGRRGRQQSRQGQGPGCDDARRGRISGADRREPGTLNPGPEAQVAQRPGADIIMIPMARRFLVVTVCLVAHCRVPDWTHRRRLADAGSGTIGHQAEPRRPAPVERWPRPGRRSRRLPTSRSN